MKKINKKSANTIIYLVSAVIFVFVLLLLAFQKGFKSNNLSESLSKPPVISIVPTEAITVWKKFTDKENIFSFNYPATFYTHDMEDCTLKLHGVSLETKKNETMCDEFTILVTRPQLTPQTEFKEGSVLLTEKIAVGSEQGMKYILKNPRGNNKNETFVKVCSSTYCLAITNVEQKISEELFNKILASVRFLK